MNEDQFYSLKDLVEALKNDSVYSDKIDKYLRIDPILNLAKISMKCIPNVLISHNNDELALFVYSRMRLQTKWSEFLNLLDFKTPNGEYKYDITIYPFGFIYSQRAKIQRDLKQVPKCWMSFWENLIVETFCQRENIEPKLKKDLIEGGIHLLSEYLDKNRIVFVFNGIEDLLNGTSLTYIDGANDFLYLTQRMSELERGNIGVIIFVHEDYARSVIKQNSGQRLAQYQDYSLCISKGNL